MTIQDDRQVCPPVAEGTSLPAESFLMAQRNTALPQLALCPGAFEKIQCTINDPHGQIGIELDFTGPSVSGTITLPDGITGKYVWLGMHHNQRPGYNTIGLHPVPAGQVRQR